MSFTAANTSKIEIYESPLPDNTTKRVFATKSDITVILDALDAMQISKEPALGFAPGGVNHIRIHKEDGTISLITYGSKAICIAPSSENTVFTVTDSHSFYETCNSLSSLEYQVSMNELDSIFLPNLMMRLYFH